MSKVEVFDLHGWRRYEDDDQEVTIVVPAQPLALRWRLAVQAAIEAYARTGKMLDAALAYARYGIPVCPCDPKTKVPIPPRDRDPITGEKINGTGGFKKATCDANQIIKWWKYLEWLIGVPMGERSGVWCLDVDSPEDHEDGISEWSKIAVEHDAIETREHRSATDGPHMLFNWQPGIGASPGAFPKGIEVKGEGSYIAVPPSRRKGRHYTVYRDSDPIDTPQWLLNDWIWAKGKPAIGKPGKQNKRGSIVGLEELNDVVGWIPNPHFDWLTWKIMAMRIFASGDKRAFPVFQTWSQKCPDYNWKGDGPAKDAECWGEVCSSPPDRTGFEKLKSIAREHGWQPGKLYPYPPIFCGEGDYISPVKREQIRKIVREFLDTLVTGKRINPFIEHHFHSDWLDHDYHGWLRALNGGPKYEREPYVPPSIVWAMQVVTGGGKTSIIIAEIAAWLKEYGRKFTPLIYAVATHDLAEEVKAKFVALGVDAQILRGYLAPDPDNAFNKKMLAAEPNIDKKKLIPLCTTPDRVQMAIETQQQISEAVCKCGKAVCPFYSGEKMCSYRGQFAHYLESGTAPDVLIVASDMLFYSHKIFESAKGVIVDESFFQKGLADAFNINLDDLKSNDHVVHMEDHQSVLRSSRNTLFRVLQQQSEDGGVKTEHLHAKLNLEDCRQALHTEWNEVARINKALSLYPGMPKQAFRRISENKELIAAIKLSRHSITVWKEIRWLLRHQKVAISGRLRLKDGMLIWQGITPIIEAFKNLPTLLPDAVLPDHSIIEVFYSQVEVVAEISAKSSPHTQVTQILDAPTSASKLEVKTNLEAVWRYILQEWLSVGCKDTLVVCQLKVEKWLREKGLPPNIFIEHYYNIAGKDGYRDFPLGIFVGRPAPGPYAIESIAGALFGEQQASIPLSENPNALYWYPSVDAGIRLMNGDGVKTTVDQHPSKQAEAVRWSKTDGELINAIGRLRLINRTADNPCVARLLFDNCLPISVDAVVRWTEPCRTIETALHGWSAENATDLRGLWPERYKTMRAARLALRDGVIRPPWFVPVYFQVPGSQKHRPGRVRVVYFDLNKIPNPQKWLEKRLGKRLIFVGKNVT